MRNRAMLVVVVSISLAVAVGCGKNVRSSISPADTPYYHFNSGWRWLDDGNIELAKKAFKKALELDPKYAPAMGGMAVLAALGGKEKEAVKKLGEAAREADSDEEKYWYEVAALRAKTILKKGDWQDDCYWHYKRASKLKPAEGAAYYFMGLAYKEDGEYVKATMLLATVITLDKGYVGAADKQWADIQKVVRAQPGTRVGKELAPKSSLTRAEVAALLLEEFRINRFFKKVDVKEERMPEGMEAPSDYKGHPFEAYIKEILKYKLRGLSFEFGPGHFEPNRAVSRAEFALVIEDILVKINHEYGLPTEFVAQAPSPFKDVDPSEGAYNAIMVSTTRGFMDADLEGFFHPKRAVSGAEALLALRRLESKLEKGVVVGK